MALCWRVRGVAFVGGAVGVGTLVVFVGACGRVAGVCWWGAVGASAVLVRVL